MLVTRNVITPRVHVDRRGSHLRWANGVRSLAVLCNLHRHRKTHRLVLEPWCSRSPQYFTLTVHLSISAYLRAFVLNGLCSCSARSIPVPKALQRFLCFPI